MRRLTAEQAQLAADHVKVAYYVARRFPAGGDRSEIEGKALEALCLLAGEFDPAAGRTFASYAFRYLRPRIVDLLRRETGKAGQKVLDTVSLDHPIEGCTENLTFADTIADPRPGPGELVDHDEELEDLRRNVDRLDGGLRYVIQRRYQDHASGAEVAVHLGVTESRVSQINAEALARLRRLMWAHDPTRSAA